jgi:pimeloyl-ACP methyl ester carboxylesterase
LELAPRDRGPGARGPQESRLTRLATWAVAAAAGGGLACRAGAIPPAARYPAGTPFSAHYVRIDNTTIRYVEAGRGPAVVLFHGIGASLYAWRHTLAPLASAGFRVIAFDNRGFGFSDKPAEGYDNASYVRLALALLDSLQLGDAVLVGHSMGGAIAAQVALEHPERVRGLVLIGSAGLGAREPRLFQLVRWPVVGPLVLSFRSRGLAERLLKSTYADPTKVSEGDVDQYYAPVAEPDFGRALRGVLTAFRFDLLGARLEHVAVPTLVMWGEEDRWIPIALGRRIAETIPHAAFLSVGHAGHSVQEEAADEVNRLVIRFLKDGLARIPPDLALGREAPYISSTGWLMGRVSETQAQ